ncbi:MAG: hypothetical protein ACRDD1_20390, partial [Planctomycetia bacterium]
MLGIVLLTATAGVTVDLDATLAAAIKEAGYHTVGVAPRLSPTSPGGASADAKIGPGAALYADLLATALEAHADGGYKVVGPRTTTPAFAEATAADFNDAGRLRALAARCGALDALVVGTLDDRLGLPSRDLLARVQLLDVASGATR